MGVSPASAAPGDIGICHATATVNNPYTFNTVDGSSTDDSEAHFEHATDPEFDWGPQGAWWNGQWYAPNTERPDLIPGITLPASFTVTRAYCDAAVEVGPRTVTPSVTWHEPTCANGNTASWSGSDTDRISYSVTSGTVAPASSVTVTAVPEPGYTFGGADAVFEHTFLAAAQCTDILVPQAPTVTQPACTGPGTSSALLVEPATGPDGVSYAVTTTAGGATVTATVTASLKEFPAQADLPQGWTRVSDTEATYPVTAEPAGACLVTVSVGVAPSATDNTCVLDGSLVLPPADGYSWTGATNGAGPGTYTVTAVADPGYSLTGTVDYTVVVEAAGDGLTCTGAPADDTLVTPLVPSATTATCSRDGSLVVPAQPAGVQVEQDGTAPGDVTFTFTPAEGYAFPEGTDTQVTVTVPEQLEGEDCIKGVDTVVPKDGKPGKNGPKDGPVNVGTDAEVLGEQAVAVPTAVAAGLGDTMTAVSTTGSPQLAQALMAAGLLMLVLGGATGLGRRTRGAHES